MSAFLVLIQQILSVPLTLYGIYLLISILLFFAARLRHDWPQRAASAVTEWPRVTIQLPIYNEPRVARRLIEAVAALDYPRERLQIQVLDDSTDRTTPLLAAVVARLRRVQHLDIQLLHRANRQGYKAGALAAALPAATGEVIAIFDADFIPKPDWLYRTLPALLSDPHLAFVQTRWGHLNRTQNVLTAAQSLALDGHFVIEQQARSAAGYLQNFNGSAGLWRRAAILEAGGWSTDTITEDLDLSYRAQLLGWRAAYLNSVETPGEVPPSLTSYRRQQHRWAKGSVQSLRKLAPAVWRSPLPLRRRLYALAHLSGYTIHLPLLGLLALTLPLGVLPASPPPVPLLGSLSFLASLAPLLLYALSQYWLNGWQGMRRLAALPVLGLLSLGLSPTLGIAVLDGARRWGGAFERTPKQGNRLLAQVTLEDAQWRDAAPAAVTFFFALLSLLVAVERGRWELALLPLLYTLGCGLVLLLAWREQAQAQAEARPLSKPVESRDAVQT